MEREEFDGLTMDKKVNYITEQFKSGLTLRKIANQLNCEIVYKNWKPFTDDWKAYSAYDLAATALIQYMEKYK